MADFAVDVITGTTKNSPGTVDYTFDLGGRIPKAVVVLAQRKTGGFGGFQAPASLSWGAATATQEWVTTVMSRDGVGTSVTRRRAASDAVLQILNDSGTVNTEASLDSFSADTVTLDFLAANSSRTMMLMAFAGDDLEVDAQVVALANGANTITTSFEPNVVIGGSIDQTTFADASVADSLLSQGFASWDGSTLRQCSATGMAEDNVGTTVCSGVAASSALLSTEGISNGVVMSSVTDTGYTLTNNSAGTVAVGLLHLKIPAPYRVWGGPVVWSHTAGGNTTTFDDAKGLAPGLDFPVDAAMMLVNRTNSTSWLAGNTAAVGATRSVCGFTSGGDFVSLVATDEHNVGTTNTASGAFTEASSTPVIRTQHNQAADIDYITHTVPGAGLEVSSTAAVTTTNRRCMLLAFGRTRTSPPDFAVDVISATTKSTTGTQDYTFDLGGRTPKAVVLVGQNGRLDFNGFISFNLLDWGAGTATTEWCCAIESKDNVGTSSTSRIATEGLIHQRFNGSGGIVETAKIDSFSANTVTLDFLTVGTSARPIMLMAFAGDDLEVDAQVAALTTGANAITTPFELTAALGGTIDQTTFADAAVADSLLSQGFSSWDGTTLLQCSATGMSEDNVGTTVCSGVAEDNAFLSTEGIGDGVVMSSVTGTGYTLTNNSAGAVAVGLLHLKIPAPYRVWGGPVSWSVTAGANTITFDDAGGLAAGLDFNVDSALMLVNRTNNWGGWTSTNTSPGATRGTCGFTSDGSFVSLLATDDNGSATTSTASGAFTEASGSPLIRAIDNTGADLTYVDHSMGTTGITIESTATATLANRRCMLLAIGQEIAEGGGIDIPNLGFQESRHLAQRLTIHNNQGTPGAATVYVTASPDALTSTAGDDPSDWAVLYEMAAWETAVVFVPIGLRYTVVSAGDDALVCTNGPKEPEDYNE